MGGAGEICVSTSHVSCPPSAYLLTVHSSSSGELFLSSFVHVKRLLITQTIKSTSVSAPNCVESGFYLFYLDDCWFVSPIVNSQPVTWILLLKFTLSVADPFSPTSVVSSFLCPILFRSTVLYINNGYVCMYI